MNSLFSVSNNNSNNLFRSMFGTSSGTGLSSNLLSDWSMIKNGTYYKLAKSYYAKNTATSESAQIKSEKSALSVAKGNASALKTAADALKTTGTASVFNKKTVTDEKTGAASSQYDTEGIYKAVKSFVDSYNQVVEKNIDSDTVSVLRKTLNMVNVTKSNQSLLSQVGITMKDDNTLALDEDAFKKADMTVAKSLFNGSGSFADRISQSAGELNTLAGNALSSIDRGTYKASGSFATSALSVGSMYDSIF